MAQGLIFFTSDGVDDGLYNSIPWDDSRQARIWVRLGVGRKRQSVSYFSRIDFASRGLVCLRDF